MANPDFKEEFEYCGYHISVTMFVEGHGRTDQRTVRAKAKSTDKEDHKCGSSEFVGNVDADDQVESTVDELLDEIDEYLSGYYEEQSDAQAGLERVMERRVDS